MHFAGSTQVGESVTNPGLYFRNNICGGLNLLDAMVRAGVRNIVFSSTAAVYGEPTAVPIPEDHPKAPTNPYGESKLFFEAILRRYETAHGIRSIALRYFNAAGAHPSGRIGEDHTPETHLIPIVLQAVLGQRDKVTVFGTDYPTEDGTCIRDMSTGAIWPRPHLGGRGLGRRRASDVQPGQRQGFSVRQVIDVAEQVVGKPIPYEEGPRRAGDPAVLVASSEKARQHRVAARLSRSTHHHRDGVALAQEHPNGYGA